MRNFCRVVRIFPQTEEEQRWIELMEDVAVSYLPFDYIQLSEDEAKDMPDPASMPRYHDDRRYTVTYDDYETADGPAEPMTITLPVLYAVWPCDKPFPAGLDYEKLYDVFYPQESAAIQRAGFEIAAMRILEKEAVSLALGSSIIGDAKWFSKPAKGSVHQWDNTLKRSVPLTDLKIRFQLGSRVWETYTSGNGNYEVPVPVPGEATMYTVYEHDKWKITTENSVATASHTWGTHYEKNGKDICIAVPLPILEIHRAVSYFYFGSHTVPKHYYPAGIRIIAHSERRKDPGYFLPSKKRNAYIGISNRDRNEPIKLLATVFHELGHFAQYGMKVIMIILSTKHTC